MSALGQRHRLVSRGIANLEGVASLRELCTLSGERSWVTRVGDRCACACRDHKNDQMASAVTWVVIAVAVHIICPKTASRRRVEASVISVIKKGIHPSARGS